MCVCVCDMGVDGMVSHMCLLIARGADIPGALRRATALQVAAGGMLVEGGSVTMDGSTIANCSGTASSGVHSSRVVGHWAGVRCVGGCGGWSVLLGGQGKGEVSLCVCVCDMGVDGMVSHMCLLIARGADIPGALRRARSTQWEACLWRAAR